MVETVCRICGYDFGYPTRGDDGASPTYDICPCCGAEVGYHDMLLEAVRKHRQRWIAGERRWRNPDEMPDDWDIDAQMSAIPPQWR